MQQLSVIRKARTGEHFDIERQRHDILILCIDVLLPLPSDDL